jgi:glycosyltransferase involved in cell wall biosynthesis
MILGIDASNIRAGGGVTHLTEILRFIDPIKYGFSKVIVWGGDKTLAQLPDYDWLIKSEQQLLNKNLFFRSYWQKFKLTKLAKKHCDVLFVPGGNYQGAFRPYVTMFQNMLLFDFKELKRFFPRLKFFHLLLLSFLQRKTFVKSDAVICLTDYGRQTLQKRLSNSNKYLPVINHGINKRFFVEPKQQLDVTRYSQDKLLRILYVSTVFPYKHQDSVVRAVINLSKQGVPIGLDLIGGGYAASLKNLHNLQVQLDADNKVIRYHSALSYQEIHNFYKQADIFIFASTCETFGNVLLEAMATGLPIACSNHQPMPEILQDAGVYFNPENVTEITSALQRLIANPGLRSDIAYKAYNLAKQYSWEKCADETFKVIAEIAQKYK